MATWPPVGTHQNRTSEALTRQGEGLTTSGAHNLMLVWESKGEYDQNSPRENEMAKRVKPLLDKVPLRTLPLTQLKVASLGTPMSRPCNPGNGSILRPDFFRRVGVTTSGHHYPHCFLSLTS